MSTLVESPKTVNPEIEDGDDWLTVLFKAHYQEMVDLAASSHIQNKINNLPVSWQITYNAYVQVWRSQFGQDFSCFPTPQEPVVDIPNDFDQWVAQMESDFGLAYQQQYSGIAAF